MKSLFFGFVVLISALTIGLFAVSLDTIPEGQLQSVFATAIVASMVGALLYNGLNIGPKKETPLDKELSTLVKEAKRQGEIEGAALRARNAFKSSTNFDHTRKPYETPLIWFVRLVDYASDRHDEGRISQEALDYARHISGTDFTITDYLSYKLKKAAAEKGFTTTSGGDYIPTFDLNDLYKDQFSGMIAMVQAFHEMTGAHIGIEPALLDEKLNQLRLSLVAEEAREGHDAKTIVELADALGDMLYVVIGWVVAAGMQNKIYDCFCEIHASNMSKACDTYEDGTLQRDKIFLASEEVGYAGHFANVFERGGRYVIVRHDGKVLKGNKYFEPNLNKFFEA